MCGISTTKYVHTLATYQTELPTCGRNNWHIPIPMTAGLKIFTLDYAPILSGASTHTHKYAVCCG